MWRDLRSIICFSLLTDWPKFEYLNSRARRPLLPRYTVGCRQPSVHVPESDREAQVAVAVKMVVVLVVVVSVTWINYNILAQLTSQWHPISNRSSFRRSDGPRSCPWLAGWDDGVVTVTTPGWASLSIELFGVSFSGLCYWIRHLVVCSPWQAEAPSDQ